MAKWYENESEALKELGERIRQQRITRNYTQSQFGKKCGLSISTITRIENGEDSKLSNIIRVLSALDLQENLESLIPKQAVSYKQIYEQTPVRRRAARKHIAAGKAWVWGEDKQE